MSFAASSPAPERAAPLPRVLFVNVGRSPRTEMMRDILDCLDIEIEAEELGLLDHLSDAEMAALNGEEGQPAISTFINDKIRVVLSREGVARRFESLLNGLPRRHYDAVVILTTGFAQDFTADCPTINGQKAVESIVLSLASRETSVGQILPLASQLEGHPTSGLSQYRLISRSAREGDRDALALAVLDLAEADLILLSSFGYSEADRAVVARATRKPVILPRRAVAAALRVVLQPHLSSQSAGPDPAILRRLASLTRRESEVLDLICAGHSNRGVAAELGISPKTVEVHRARVMAKMEAGSLAGLIADVLAVKARDPRPV